MLEWVGHYVDLDYMLWVRTQRRTYQNFEQSAPFSYPGEMAALPNYFDLCDSPNGSPHPHLCVFPLLVHLSGPQKEADKVVLVGLRTEGVIFISRKVGGWVEQGEISFDLFWSAGR